MIKKYVKLLPLMAIFSIPLANAGVALKDDAEIAGKWKLYAEAAKLDGEKKSLIVEWEFKPGGVLQTTGTDPGGRTKEMVIDLKYSVENGDIKKQTSPGREKYETCKVVEKDNSGMVLKCMYLYYFLTKL
ncbi:MAG: hypothetical protein HOP23_03520 [Methylococcaceae bacterium]|nr:hypothetical protein [Methylococcaceae bacterium]